MRLTSVLAGAAMMAAAAVVTADTAAAADPEDAIKARRGYYQIVKLNAGVLFAIAKGEMEYDAGAATAAANNLVTLTEMNNANMWVPGTSKSEMPGKTRALMNIWDGSEDVGAKVAAFKKAVADMADAAAMDADSIRDAAGALGKSCKGCHDTIRAKDF
jgi:cytochrome c556